MKKALGIMIMVWIAALPLAMGAVLFGYLTESAAADDLNVVLAEPEALTPVITDNTQSAGHLPLADLVKGQLAAPISRPQERVNKKPFGLLIIAGHSPVENDRFSGYHVGVDFETFADEQEIAVPITAACDGKLILKKQAQGYGGVAVQACRLQGEEVTIIYGHLKLESVTVEVGRELKSGDQIGILGQGYSPETDGVRKHLHFGIHRGPEINIAGYVKDPAEVEARLDAMTFIKN